MVIILKTHILLFLMAVFSRYEQNLRRKTKYFQYKEPIQVDPYGEIP